VIAERVVLFRVDNVLKRRDGSPRNHARLGHFVEHPDRVFFSALSEALKICPAAAKRRCTWPMAANFGFRACRQERMRNEFLAS